MNVQVIILLFGNIFLITLLIRKLLKGLHLYFVERKSVAFFSCKNIERARSCYARLESLWTALACARNARTSKPVKDTNKPHHVETVIMPSKIVAQVNCRSFFYGIFVLNCERDYTSSRSFSTCSYMFASNIQFCSK